MKISAIIFAALVSMGIAVSQTSDPPLSAFQKELAEAGGGRLDKLLDQVWQSGNLEEIKAVLNEPTANSISIQLYQHKPPSINKDRFTILHLSRPWDYDGTPENPYPLLKGLPWNTLQPFATYMQERVGFQILDPESPEQLMEAGKSLENRIYVARQFEEALIKKGLATESILPPVDKSNPESRPRPPRNRDSSLNSGKTTNAVGAAQENPETTKTIIISAAVVALIGIGISFYVRRNRRIQR